MDATRKLLSDIKRNVPQTGKGRQHQREKCGLIIQDLDNYEDAVLKGLSEVDFKDIENLKKLQRNIISWKRLFDKVDEFRDEIGRQLGGATNLHKDVVRSLQEIQIEVGLVISRAIARLAVLAEVDDAEEEKNLETYFRDLKL